MKIGKLAKRETVKRGNRFCEKGKLGNGENGNGKRETGNLGNGNKGNCQLTTYFQHVYDASWWAAVLRRASTIKMILK